MHQQFLESLKVAEFAFPGPLRDELLAAILAGTKTASSSLLREYRVSGDALPLQGERFAVVDSRGRRVFAIEVVEVRIVPLNEVALSHAIAEGEGYQSVQEWRAGHMQFWSSAELRAEIGEDFVIDDSTQIVLERFVLFSDSAPDSALDSAPGAQTP